MHLSQVQFTNISNVSTINNATYLNYTTFYKGKYCYGKKNLIYLPKDKKINIQAL